ncbi:hypothetical protein [Streptomyces sp. NPDC051572]|uniref:hypothetical protein n=1 Tax=Streptomyces sp. NPDC051572 TaxID=3155802 RepID=UPI00344C0A78
MDTTSTSETPITNYGVEDCDPAVPAPPVVLTNTSEMKSPGHGYTLPLVGRERPHAFEAILADKSLRVFADRPADILTQLIGDYAAINSELTQAETTGDDDVVGQLELRAFEARSTHASAMRRHLQQAINEQAQQDGTWSDLDDEERQQLTNAAAADGDIPAGVLYTAPAEDDLGNQVEEELGLWSASVPLVINRGEYDIADPDVTVSEPQSDLETKMPDGRMVVVVVEDPANLLRLDPVDDYTYLQSLARAGVVVVTEREPVQVDELFMAAMETGAAQ